VTDTAPAPSTIVLDPWLAAAGAGARVLDLARPMVAGMPQSPNHPQFRLAMPRRHGDGVRADGGSAANDVLVTGTHVGTHIDALGHVSHDGRLHGGADAAEVQRGGRLASHGVDEIAPIVARGVLLDVPAAHGTACWEAGAPITPGDLERTAAAHDLDVRSGDVVLVRSGWGRHWGDAEAYLGHATGVPGADEAAARWLADRGVRAVGADTIAFEHLPPGRGHALLPAHRVLLVERGIPIIETMALDELAASGIREFLLVVAPLPLVGATGSPVRPLAVVAP
jgi:kynurenine formamidase